MKTSMCLVQIEKKKKNMKELSKNQQIIMAIGATLMVIGVGCFVFGFLPKVFSVVFMVGAVCFAIMQMIQASYDDGKSVTLRRLKRIMIIGDICFILAGLLMLENSFMVLYKFLSWETWLTGYLKCRPRISGPWYILNRN